MRLWSVHPQYFDRQALTACWREGLLAQAVIDRPESGYGRHPQLDRFRAQPDPAFALSAYLSGIVDEAEARGYRFARNKIAPYDPIIEAIPVPYGQLEYEWLHLMAKLEQRSPDIALRWCEIRFPEPHPLFTVVGGRLAPWERPKPGLGYRDLQGDDPVGAPIDQPVV